MAGDVTAAGVLALVRAWRVAPDKPVGCPACGTGTLAIVDRSARPYREWYAVSCAGCGFEKTVTVSLGPPMGGD